MLSFVCGSHQVLRGGHVEQTVSRRRQDTWCCRRPVWHILYVGGVCPSSESNHCRNHPYRSFQGVMVLLMLRKWLDLHRPVGGIRDSDLFACRPFLDLNKFVDPSLRLVMTSTQRKALWAGTASTGRVFLNGFPCTPFYYTSYAGCRPRKKDIGTGVPQSSSWNWDGVRNVHAEASENAGDATSKGTHQPCRTWSLYALAFLFSSLFPFSISFSRNLKETSRGRFIERADGSFTSTLFKGHWS